MSRKNAGAGGMPENAQISENAAAEKAPVAPMAENVPVAPAAENAPIEVERDAPKQQPEFRVVQPEYSVRDNKTIFKDVGALWKNVSQKTGKEFYTLKIGKMRLLVFPNQKLVQ